MRAFYVITLLMLLCSAVPFAQQKKVVAIGSSTTAGQGAFPADSSWVRRFSNYYKNQQHLIDSIYNLGVGGYTCYKGMPDTYTPLPGHDAPDPDKNVSRANSLLNGLAIAADGVVIINYPTNGYVTLTIPEVMTCLQTMYDSVIQAGHRCYITTTQPRTDGSFNTSAIKRKLADLKDSIINRFGVNNTLNFWDGMFEPADTTILAAYSAGDNIHFNNAGHRVLYERAVAKNMFSVTLPVHVFQLSGTALKQGIRVEWMATDCSNTNSFVVERGADGMHFSQLQQVTALQKSGEQRFGIMDAHPLSGNNYYRLTYQSATGPQFSEVITIANKAFGFEAGTPYPVPARQLLTIPVVTGSRQAVTVRIFNHQGQLLLQNQYLLSNGSNQLHLPVQKLAAGCYAVQLLSAEGTAFTQTFTK